eukprot:INCI18051.3.p1 GENE.INCI18051.3~~INCI18051.3.p1  ORF type:complete len:962 (+),score=128.27 INCI18051.3:108-2888(+)
MAGQPPSDFKRFVAAVKCLSTGENIKSANDWLMKFKALDAAWAVTVQCLGQAALEGLDGEDMEMVHFQAASMLKDKIRKSGEDLVAAQRLQLRQRLIVLINGFHGKGAHKVALQLCIALANLAVVDEHWNDVIVTCASGFSSLAQREMLLVVLKYFPDQLYRHDRNTISVKRMKALQAQLVTYSPHVLKLIQHSLTVKPLLDNPRSLKAILECFAKWLRFGEMQTTAITSTPGLIELCFRALERPHCFNAASDAIYEFVCALRRRREQAVAMQIIIPRVLKLGEKFKQFCAPGAEAGHHDDIVNLSEIFGQLASTYVDFMVGPPAEAQLMILQLLQICTNHNVKRVQRQPHLFWRLLADKLVEMPPSPQKAALLQRYMPFIQQTLNKALLAVMYPPDYGDMGDGGEREDVQDFRLVTKDLIFDLRLIIGPKPVVDTCARAMGNASFKANLHGVEAVFVAVYVANSASAARNAPGDGMGERAAIGNFLFPSLMPYLNSLYASNQWYLQHTAFHFIYEFADWFGQHPEHNSAAFRVVVQGIEHKHLLAECVPAFLAMCECSSQLIASQPTVGTVINALFGRAAKCKQPQHQFDLMRGISMIIGQVPTHQIMGVLRPIMQPIAQLLGSALAKPPSRATEDQILQALDMISGCFCSLSHLGRIGKDGAGGALVGASHPTNQFFKVLWPTFRDVMKKYADNPDVVEKQCRCFKHMLRSAGVHFESAAGVFAKQIGESFSRHPEAPLLYIGGVLAEVMAPVAAVRPLVLNLISLFIKKVVPLLTSKKLLRKHPDVTDDFFDCLTRVVDYYPKELFQLNGIAAATMMGCNALRVRHEQANRSVQVFFRALLRIHDPSSKRTFHPQRAELSAFLAQQDGAIPKALIATILAGMAGGLASDRLYDRQGSLPELLLATVAVFPATNPGNESALHVL